MFNNIKVFSFKEGGGEACTSLIRTEPKPIRRGESDILKVKESYMVDYILISLIRLILYFWQPKKFKRLKIYFSFV